MPDISDPIVVNGTNRTEPGLRRSSIWAFRGALSRQAQIGIGVGTSVGLLLIWETVARLGLVNTTFLPSPSTVMSSMLGMIQKQNLLQHASISTLRVWVAFVLAAVMAIPIGILMSSYRVVGAALEPIIDFIRYLPVPALVPLSIIWFGVGESTKLYLLWLGTFFQLVLLVADDMRRGAPEYFGVAPMLRGETGGELRGVAVCGPVAGVGGQ